MALKLRCSGLPLTMLCAASLDQQGPRIETGDQEAAVLGTAAHLVLTRWIDGDRDYDPDEVASTLDVDPGELGLLCRFGWQAWERVRHHFAHPQTELPLEHTADGITLSGHLDVLSDAGLRLYIADWKTGRVDADHEHQLRGYAWLALANHPEAAGVSAVSIRVRDGIADWHSWDREEMSRWWQRLVAHVRDRDTFRPGRHCGHCPRGATCQAKTDLLVQMASSLIPAHEAMRLPKAEAMREISGQLTDLQLVQLHLASRAVRVAVEIASDIVRAEVQRRGGRVTDPAINEMLELRDQVQRHIDYAAGRQVLEEEFEPEALARCLDVRKTRVEEEVKASAGKGQKGRAVKELMERLDAVGAITRKTITRLEVTRNGSSAAAITNTGTDNRAC